MTNSTSLKGHEQRIEEKAKDDRMSNHGAFIAAKRWEIASLTAKIETKRTWQGDPAVATVETESMKNEIKDAELSCAEAKEPWPAREIWKQTNSQPFTKQRSSMASQFASTVEVELPNSRQCFETVSVLWFASSTCGAVTWSASEQLHTDRRLVMRWCAYSMRNLVEMTARSRVAPRVSTRSVLRK